MLAFEFSASKILPSQMLFQPFEKPWELYALQFYLLPIAKHG